MFIGCGATVNRLSIPTAPQTIAFTANPPASAAYNSQFTVAASASSGLPVSYASSGSCTNSGSTYAISSGAGTCSVIISQAGDAHYKAAQITQGVTATKAPQTIAFTASPPVTAAYNSQFTVTASASSGLPVGYASSGSCTNSGSTYTISQGAGACAVVISQAGNANYTVAHITQGVTTTTALQIIAFTANPPATAAYNSQFTVAASASSGLPVSYASSGSCVNSGLTYTVTSRAGACSVIISQAGNANYTAAQISQSVTAMSLAETFPTFSVFSYGASGSSQSYTCSGQAESRVLTCTQPSTDFTVGEGIRIVAAGDIPVVPAITAPIPITSIGPLTGQHQYCYIVYAADAFGGITAGSQPSCINGEPDLSFTGTHNALGGTYTEPTAILLWYRSVDGGPYRLITVGNYAQDVGQQPDAHGGWSDPLPQENISKNEDVFSTVTAASGNQITISEPIISTVSSTLVDHDDTAAIQSTIDATAATNGGIVQFPNGTFNIRRPSFQYVSSTQPVYPLYTTDYSLGQPWGRWSYLHIANGSSGNISLQGNDASSVLATPPDQGSAAIVFQIGNYTNPAYAPFSTVPIEEVEKGATSLTLTPTADVSNFPKGTDIWIYTGSFTNSSPPCVDSNGTAGGGCHYSELNTVTGVSGQTLSLAYPTSKRYYDDGRNSFGIVALPVTPHNIEIQDLTFTSYTRILYSGFVYGLLLNRVVVNGVMGFGAFGGGYKRDVLIENSVWNFGRTDASGWADEYDQFTNLVLLNNVITGYSAPGTEGQSAMARLYMTEGTSGVILKGNEFNHSSTYIQTSTDDLVEGNSYTDGILTLGGAYHPYNNSLLFGNLQDVSFSSFDSQESASVVGNTFTIHAGFAPPWILGIGHFASATVSKNVIAYDNADTLAAIVSGGGAITGNTITFGPNSTGSWAIGLDPDQAPNILAAAFDVESNTITAQSAKAGIYVADPGFSDTAPVCIQGNFISITQGTDISVQTPGDIIQSCQ